MVPPDPEPCPLDSCPHPKAMHDEECRCWFPNCDCHLHEYQVTFQAWYLMNVAVILAHHRRHRRRPWL